MYFTFKRNNQRTKKPVNRFLQDGISAGIQSLQTSIVVKLRQTHFTWDRFEAGTEGLYMGLRSDPCQIHQGPV